MSTTRPARPARLRDTQGLGRSRTFLAIGPGAEQWLTLAAAAGTSRVRRKLAEAVDLPTAQSS